MRIFFIGAAPAPDTMERHVLATLRAMRHEVVHHNANDLIHLPKQAARIANSVARRFLREPERIQESRLIAKIWEYQPDLVLALLGSMVSPKGIAKIKQECRVPVVCWCQDQMTTLGRQYLIGAPYDAIFVKDHYLLGHLRDLCGLNAHYLAEACNPDVHKSCLPDPEVRRVLGADICTYGSLYYYRQRILESLVDYDLRVWGPVPDWLINRIPEKVMGRSIFEEEKSKALSNSKIVVNTLHFGEVQSLNARAFEVAGCGACQLITHNDTVADHFEIGKEIDTYRTLNELKEKIDFYLANEDVRTEMGRAAQARAHRDHTYQQRLATLLSLSGP
ncbi:MAG: glycosyltransferase [Pseudomonadota bacterium]